MKSNDFKIVGLGDSITFGYPYEPALSWLNIAVERLNLTCINQGINGDTTDGMLLRFHRHVVRYNPSHVIIMGGTNDAYAASDVEQVSNNIREIVALAVQNNIIPVLGLPIPCNDIAEEKLLGQYREEMRCIARDNDVKIIDFHQAMVDETGVNIKKGLHCDGVHPTESGYEVMADIAADVLSNVFVAARVHDYYWNQDLSCALTTLKILSEVLYCELHPQVIEAAYGLNAGRLASQCGLAEGALMFIGIYGRQQGIESEHIAELCQKFSSDFQEEFGSVLCKELRPQGFHPDNPPHLCEKLTTRTIAFSVDFISKKILLTA